MYSVERVYVVGGFKIYIGLDAKDILKVSIIDTLIASKVVTFNGFKSKGIVNLNTESYNDAIM